VPFRNVQVSKSDIESCDLQWHPLRRQNTVDTVSFSSVNITNPGGCGILGSGPGRRGCQQRRRDRRRLGPVQRDGFQLHQGRRQLRLVKPLPRLDEVAELTVTLATRRDCVRPLSTPRKEGTRPAGLRTERSHAEPKTGLLLFTMALAVAVPTALLRTAPPRTGRSAPFNASKSRARLAQAGRATGRWHSRS